MSKQDPENQSVVPETSVQSLSGARNLEQTLLKLNVNDHTEKKQNLTYLSWAWAWAEALKVDPDANFKVHLFGDKPFMDVNGTAMVWVTVALGGKSRACFLPVMDHRNKPITNPDAFQVNTSLMRCLTKCLALFGLGLYIYAGEDLPEESKAVKEEVKDVQDKPEDLALFADSLIGNLTLHDTEQALRGYWKANVETIDKLKAQMPEAYARVQKAFSEAKQALNKE
jgi:hypothetical protein